jgi:hypothetical protein
MVLTEFQREICRLLAKHRIASGESYLAGGATLNEMLTAPRVSRDIDLFHDSSEALEQSWESDRDVLLGQGFGVWVIRERPYFVEAEVSRGDEGVLMQWARDSAFRFFPLVEDDDLGLVLHPFDLATNKVLALVGRLEVRDWVDVIECSRRLQHLGYLAWAAPGKDPGFSPASILGHAARSARYSEQEVAALSFDGEPPDAAVLAGEWREILAEASEVHHGLPGEMVGTCVLDADRRLFNGDPDALRRALEQGDITFHAGSIRGTLPTPVTSDPSR